MATSSCGDEPARITVFPAGCRTHIVGDGDFAFAAALTESRLRVSVPRASPRGAHGDKTAAEGATESAAEPDFVATCYDSAEEIERKYAHGPCRVEQLRAAGACVEFGVDATLLAAGPYAKGRSFDRVVFNFPQIPGSKDVARNRMMLSRFLKAAETVLAPAGLVVIANKSVSPYCWWRLEALPAFADCSGLELAAELPWARTEYPSLYSGPCNVDRDQSVNAGDAIIFVYARPGRSSMCGLPVPSDVVLGPRELHCEICRVWPQKEIDFKSHVAGKMHRKRLELEKQWEALVASEAEVAATRAKRPQADAEDAPFDKRPCH